MEAVSHFSKSIRYMHWAKEIHQDYPNQIHNFWELLYVKKGQAVYTVEGKSYPFSENMLILTRPTKLHSICFENGTYYERHNILFDQHLLSSDVCDRLPKDLDVVYFAGNVIVDELFQKMDFYCKRLAEKDLDAVLLHLTEELLHNVLLASAHLRTDRVYIANPLVLQAVEYIESHLTQPLSVEEVSNYLHITTSYLLQLFNTHLKISPKKYILSKKLTMTQLALSAGAKPTEVYHFWGFSDYSTFFRAYRSHFGYAPSDTQAIDLSQAQDI